jgi:hypothetical protein
VRLVAIGAVLDPDVAADDGLDAVRARGLVELDHAEHVGEIGQRERRHAVGDRGGHRIVNAHDAVGHRIFAVQPEVDVRRVVHGFYFIVFDFC